MRKVKDPSLVTRTLPKSLYNNNNKSSNKKNKNMHKAF